jgi:biotin carboxyl carrier protein
MDIEIRQNGYKSACKISMSQLIREGISTDYEILQRDQDYYVIRIGTKIIQVYDVKVNETSVGFKHEGIPFRFEIRDEQALLLEKMGFKSSSSQSAGKILSPMPGKILHLFKTQGDSVQIGEPVAVLEAMKMENEIKSPVNGTVDRVFVEIGDSVEKKHIILEIN